MGMLVGCVKLKPLKNDNKNKLMTPLNLRCGNVSWLCKIEAPQKRQQKQTHDSIEFEV
jgi:hypothetical protein